MSGPFIIQRTFRAYSGAETVLEAWVRDDDGRHDLSDAEVSVNLKRPPNSTLATLEATGSAQGKVSFTVSAADIQRIGSGSFVTEIVADGSVVGIGILEVLG